MQIDQGKVIAALGGSRVVQGMDSEAKAEALELYLSDATRQRHLPASRCSVKAADRERA